MLPAADGWTLSNTVSRLPLRPNRFGIISGAALVGHKAVPLLPDAARKSRCLPSRASSQMRKGGLVNLAAHVNPVEKLATNIRDAVAGAATTAVHTLCGAILSTERVKGEAYRSREFAVLCREAGSYRTMPFGPESRQSSSGPLVGYDRLTLTVACVQGWAAAAKCLITRTASGSGWEWGVGLFLFFANSTPGCETSFSRSPGVEFANPGVEFRSPGV